MIQCWENLIFNQMQSTTQELKFKCLLLEITGIMLILCQWFSVEMNNQKRDRIECFLKTQESFKIYQLCKTLLLRKNRPNAHLKETILQQVRDQWSLLKVLPPFYLYYPIKINSKPLPSLTTKREKATSQTGPRWPQTKSPPSLKTPTARTDAPNQPPPKPPTPRPAFPTTNSSSPESPHSSSQPPSPPPTTNEARSTNCRTPTWRRSSSRRWSRRRGERSRSRLEAGRRGWVRCRGTLRIGALFSSDRAGSSPSREMRNLILLGLRLLKWPKMIQINSLEKEARKNRMKM